jgi:hypothetical protein
VCPPPPPSTPHPPTHPHTHTHTHTLYCTLPPPPTHTHTHTHKQVDLEAACAHHRASFSNPSEFTLVLTGNTSLEALLPLLARYLATIPAAEGRGGRRDPRTLTPLPFRFPEQPMVEDVEVRAGAGRGAWGWGGERGGIGSSSSPWRMMWRCVEFCVWGGDLGSGRCASGFVCVGGGLWLVQGGMDTQTRHHDAAWTVHVSSKPVRRHMPHTPPSVWDLCHILQPQRLCNVLVPLVCCHVLCMMWSPSPLKG